MACRPLAPAYAKATADRGVPVSGRRTTAGSGHTHSLQGGNQQRREEVHRSIGLLDEDLGRVRSRGQNKIGVYNPVFTPVRQTNHERGKRDCPKQLTNTSFHTTRRICSP